MTVLSEPFAPSSSITLKADASAVAMAASPWGRDVALAGRKGLYIIDLDNPYSPPRWLRHLTSWEVADVQWSPHPQRNSWVCSSSNQKGIIWDLSRDSANAHQHILHGHERAITDINFHNKHPDMLATCSIDAHCFVWDLRINCQKPTFMVCDWENGASQIKWNHFNEFIFATSHGEKINIWDIRKNNKPLIEIFNAHSGKINGLNFSKQIEDELISCSSDKTVKSWSFNSNNVVKPNFIINTSFPVSKSRFLPFGDAMAIMPLRGGNNSLQILKTPKINTITNLLPDYSFNKNGEKPLSEFLWSKKPNSDLQLLTYGKDKTLKIWKIDSKLFDIVGKNYLNNNFNNNNKKKFKYKTFRDEPSFNNSSGGKITNILTSDVNWLTSDIENYNHLDWISNVIADKNDYDKIDPFKIAEELRIIKMKENFKDIELENIHVDQGKITIILNSSIFSKINELIQTNDLEKPVFDYSKNNFKKKIEIKNDKIDEDLIKLNDDKETKTGVIDTLFLRIRITFPKLYPKNPLNFHIESNHDLTDYQRDKLLVFLKYIAKRCSKISRFCLDLIFQFLLGQVIKLDLITLEEEISINNNTDDKKMEFDETKEVSDNDESDDYNINEIENLEIAESIHPFELKNWNVPGEIISGANWAPNGQLIVFNSSKFGKKSNKVVYNCEKYIHYQSYRLQYDDGDDDDGDESENSSDNDIGLNYNLTNKFDLTNKIYNIVSLLTFDDLLPMKYELAKNYQIIPLINQTNFDVVRRNSRIVSKFIKTSFSKDSKEINDIWKLIKIIVKNDSYFDWNFELIKQIMDYLEKKNNLQMLAMLSCILIENKSIISNTEIKNSMFEFKTGYKLINEPTIKLETNFNELNDYKITNYFSMNFLKRLKKYRDIYSDILLSWNLPIKRIEILKFNYQQQQQPSSYKLEINFDFNYAKLLSCDYCNEPIKKKSIQCCHNCHHILHVYCSKKWFKSVRNFSTNEGIEEDCPTGCGCKCLRYL